MASRQAGLPMRRTRSAGDGAEQVEAPWNFSRSLAMPAAAGEK